MRYTIEGFSQAYAMTLKKQVERNGKSVTIKIDCTDLVILRWFVDFYPKMQKHIIKDKEYAWVNHNKLIEDLPLIDISRQAFIERMQKLCEFEILEYYLIKEKGNLSVYTFGCKYPCMVEDTTLIGSNQQGLIGSTTQPLSVQTNNNNNINNYSINDSNKEITYNQEERKSAKAEWSKALKYLEKNMLSTMGYQTFIKRLKAVKIFNNVLYLSSTPIILGAVTTNYLQDIHNAMQTLGIDGVEFINDE